MSCQSYQISIGMPGTYNDMEIDGTMDLLDYFGINEERIQELSGTAMDTLVSHLSGPKPSDKFLNERLTSAYSAPGTKLAPLLESQEPPSHWRPSEFETIGPFDLAKRARLGLSEFGPAVLTESVSNSKRAKRKSRKSSEPSANPRKRKKRTE